MNDFVPIAIKGFTPSAQNKELPTDDREATLHMNSLQIIPGMVGSFLVSPIYDDVFNIVD